MLLSDLLWSDPEAQVETWAVSPRGGGYLFGSMPTNAVGIIILKYCQRV
jgi:diadenosine tetraphosphatase ApaH/serine/threonine PP2A family protein phosphatase